MSQTVYTLRTEKTVRVTSPFPGCLTESGNGVRKVILMGHNRTHVGVTHSRLWTGTRYKWGALGLISALLLNSLAAYFLPVSLQMTASGGGSPWRPDGGL